MERKKAPPAGGGNELAEGAPGGNGEVELLPPEQASEVEADEQLAALAALARLDLDAAGAYRVAADAIGDEDIEAILMEFSNDHLRHVDDLNGLIVARGGQPVPRAVPEPSLLGPLMETAIAVGGDVAIMALLGNEQLTNRSYEVALEIEWDEESQRILDRNAEDEQRHLAWLAEAEDELWAEVEAEAEPDGPEPPPAA